MSQTNKIKQAGISCGTCIYYRDGEPFDSTGACKKGQPYPGSSLTQESWPKVTLAEWCGEWVSGSDFGSFITRLASQK